MPTEWGGFCVIIAGIVTILVSFKFNCCEGMCGRRGSPAYRIAENIVENPTDKDWTILRCFVSRMLQAELTGEDLSLQPSLFLNCVLNEMGVTRADRYDILDVDNHLSNGRGSHGLTGRGLHPCIYQKMSCPESRHIVQCKLAIDKAAWSQPTYDDGAQPNVMDPSEDLLQAPPLSQPDQLSQLSND